jgi:CTP:molybdopterin cytidylyltransferase MocA
MADALKRLSEADEMQTLVAEAQAHGRRVVVHVFHSAEGHPILIHLKAVAQEEA